MKFHSKIFCNFFTVNLESLAIPNYTITIITFREHAAFENSSISKFHELGTVYSEYTDGCHTVLPRGSSIVSYFN